MAGGPPWPNLPMYNTFRAPPAGARTFVRRGDPHRQPGGHHRARAAGAARGARDCRRGYPPHRQVARTRGHRDADGQPARAQRGGSPARHAGAASSRGGGRPGDRRRHSPAVRPRRPTDSRRPGRGHRRRTHPWGQRGARGTDDERRPVEPVHVFRVSTRKTGSASPMVRGSRVVPASRRLFRGPAPHPPDPGNARATSPEVAGRVAVCREITKRHEELIRAPLADVGSHPSIADPVGEFTCILEVGEARNGEILRGRI